MVGTMKLVKSGSLTRLKYGRADCKYMVFRGSMKYEEVLNFTTTLSKGMKAKGINGKMEVGIRSDLFEWKSGAFFNIGNDASIWNPTTHYRGDVDWELIEKFQTCRIHEIFITYFKTNNAGGKGEYNDCLYDCLKEGYAGSDVFITKFSHPYKLKKFLNLDRKAMIPIDMMKQLEDTLKSIAINVTGDYTYTSSKDTTKLDRVLNIKLYQGHYTLIHDANRSVPKGYSYKPRKLLIRYNKGGEHTDKVYDGIKFYTEQHDIFTTDEYKYKYIYIFVKHNDDKLMIDTFNKFRYEAEELKTATDNKINLYCSNGGSDVIVAKRLFHAYTKHIKAGDKMLQVESEWHESCYNGGLMFCDAGYKGEGHEYDIVSAYLHVLCQSIDLPINAGVFLQAKDEDIKEFFKYGIYRCEIDLTKTKYEKLIKINNKNYYTSYELKFFRELGCIINLIHDDQPNFLSYDSTKRIRAETMFKSVVEYLFALKQNNVTRAKSIMQKIWGICCEKNKYNIRLTRMNDVEIKEGRVIDHIIPINIDREEFEIIYHEESNIYNGEYPRIKSFITAYARVMIGMIMKPHYKYIVRCQTDGFITTKPIESKHIGVDLGDLKYKGRCESINIVNVNCIKGADGNKAEYNI